MSPLPRVDLESASGLRPAAAFVLVGATFLVVLARAAQIALVEPGEQPRGALLDVAPAIDFEIADQGGRALALSVECFDLSVSPHALWRAHTPDRIARRVAGWIGGTDERALLERMLPPEARAGWITTSPGGLCAFDAAASERVQAWIASGAPPQAERAPTGRLEGLALEPAGAGLWTLAWSPELALSRGARLAHLPAAADRPELWTARLLGDLGRLVDPARLPRDLRGLEGSARTRALADALWAELMPCRFRVVERRIEPRRAHELAEGLAAEGISPWQAQLEPSLGRRHPVRPEAGADPRGDAFALLGHWGVLGPEAARARARRELGLEPGAEPGDARERAELARREHALATEWRPRSGLELLCASLLARPEWEQRLDPATRWYERRPRVLPRDRRAAWAGAVPDYYLAAGDAMPVPQVVSTLDAELQSALHAELLAAMAAMDPALAMGIVLEVQSGEVLALDAVHAYPVSGFAPLRHAFTPGSTMKAVVMALALDAGVVAPDDRFATFAPEGIRVSDESGRGRRVREAEGAPEEAWISARAGLAQSVNAVLVQIGLRLPPAHFHAQLARLGYGRAPGAGIGPESAGYLPPLRGGTWKRRFTHTSVSFGHEISVSLWQHAAALATIARGGASLPLRLLRGVRQGDARWDLAAGEGERVLARRACHTLLDLMNTAAREGTGERVAGPEAAPELWEPGAFVGTKTGTTEKVWSELCLHVELEHNTSVHADGSACLSACRARLVGERRHHGLRNTCYTSSMLAIGRRAGEERELLVLVVVDEPRARVKFGADVAGPTTMRVLRRALGLPPSLEEARLAAAPAFTDPALFNERDFPWAQGSQEGAR